MMRLYLALWVLLFVSLMAALGLLSGIYRLLGADLGLGRWRRETIIAIVVSVLQAATLAAGLALTGTLVSRLAPVAMIVLVLTYRLTHLAQSMLEDTGEVSTLGASAIAITQFVLLFLGVWLVALLVSRVG